MHLKTYQLHVDTASLNKTAGIQSFVTKRDGNPFTCQVLFGNRHRALKSISLKNAQIPIGYFNIRAPYNVINLNNTDYIIPEGVYSGTGPYLSAINGAISASGILLSTLGTWSFVNSKAVFTSTAGSVTLTLPTNLNYPTIPVLLGFTPTQTLIGNVLTSQNSYIINFDTYISIWIENLGQSSQEPAAITFKIPVNVNNGSILHWSENTQNTQKVLVTDNSVRVDRLNITVLDRFGVILNNNGIDWSFTLEIESDT